MSDPSVHGAPASTIRVVFVVAPGVHLLDLAGPAQVFGTVSQVSDQTWNLAYVAEAPTIPSFQGMTLHADTAWPDLSPNDLVVVPGWRVERDRPTPKFGASTLAHLSDHHRRGGTVMSVCAGAFALAQAGLLDGRRATTHHDLQDELARRFPQVKVVRDVLFVSDGDVHTSAGIASGIDLALHVVSQRLGPRTASQVARGMVVFARRNGNEPQDSIMLRRRDHLDDLVHRVQDIIDHRYAQTLPLSHLADETHVSQRTLTRAFERALGMSPLRYQQLLRREHAERLIATGASIESAAREVGFEDARMLRTLRRRPVEDD